MYILIPGRHHVVTNFQFQYLFRLIHSRLIGEKDQSGRNLPECTVEGIVFAVTSANHRGTRRNPFSYARRAMAIQDFSRDLPVPVYCFPVTDVGYREDFAEYTLKAVNHGAEGIFELNRGNCLVSCSTAVGKLYEKLGYPLYGAELTAEGRDDVHNPWELIKRISLAEDWETDKILLNALHPASYRLLRQYNLAQKVRFLFSDPVISEDGDLTDTRDYASYVRQMDDNTRVKWGDTADHIQPGRIGDIGCATGSWLKYAAAEPRLQESDLYGVELTRQLSDICHQRKENREFTNPNIWFSQKNALSGLVFKGESMNTIHTGSLTHEIESYGSREDLLRFIRNRRGELLPRGVWINRDVIGPEEKDRPVLMRLNRKDGQSQGHPRELSTYHRFLKFAGDFRKDEGYSLSYHEKELRGDPAVELKLEDAAEFMLTKDYTDNWESEMHERFCFWSFSDWKKALEEAGFSVSPGSRVFTNPWIRKNRWEGKVRLYDGNDSEIIIPTNMVMIARKTL